MNTSLMTAFREARAALVAERRSVVQRLAQIDAALSGGTPLPFPTAEMPVPAVRPPDRIPPERSRRAARIPGRRHRATVAPAAAPAAPKVELGALNLREAVMLVLADGPSRRADLLRRIHDLGYRFNRSNPIAALDQLLEDARSGVILRGGKFALA